jgi:hypothetical protein
LTLAIGGHPRGNLIVVSVHHIWAAVAKVRKHGGPGRHKPIKVIGFGHLMTERDNHPKRHGRLLSRVVLVKCGNVAKQKGKGAAAVARQPPIAAQPKTNVDGKLALRKGKSSSCATTCVSIGEPSFFVGTNLDGKSAHRKGKSSSCELQLAHQLANPLYPTNWLVPSRTFESKMI